VHQQLDRQYGHDATAEQHDQPGHYTTKVFYAIDRAPDKQLEHYLQGPETWSLGNLYCNRGGYLAVSGRH
jgi:hypothetical protein